VGLIKNKIFPLKFFTKNKYIIDSFRLQSWVGWLAIFGVGSILFRLPNFFNLALNTFSFFTITAAIFIQNQYFDRESDRNNPNKKSLPIASGQFSPKFALVIMTLLLFSGVVSILVSNILLLPLYSVYFALWSIYSTPIFHLKNKSGWDLVLAGIGSGILPFIIGVQVSSQLSFEYHLPWIQGIYLDTFLCVLPIFFFQIACQIFQEILDLDADIQAKIDTFVVKHGAVKSIRIALISVLLSLILPTFFGLLGFGHADQFLLYYSIFLLTISPLVINILNLWKNPTQERINSLAIFSKKYSLLIMLAIFIYILLLRIYIS
jgi:4-hydroxybenzoate polyprenyltransferase